MMHWMIVPLKRYADFSGRSRRMEYWMFQLLNFSVTIALVILMLASLPWSDMANDTGKPHSAPPEFGPLFWVSLVLLGLWVMGTLVPNIAVHVRRFHDQDKSGWMYLISFIPYIGGLIVMVFMFMDGTRGANQYGPDPKARSVGDVFS